MPPHDEHDAAPEPLRFERRSERRLAVHGVATGFQLSGDRFGRIHELRLEDCSECGLCGVCDAPVAPGVTMSLGFGEPGRLARRGIVTRCQPCGNGYRIAVRFQYGLAA